MDYETNYEQIAHKNNPQQLSPSFTEDIKINNQDNEDENFGLSQTSISKCHIANELENELDNMSVAASN